MIGLIGALLPIVQDVIESLIEEPEKKRRARAELQQAFFDRAGDIEKAAAEIVRTEAQGESWLQRNWRPMIMCLFGYIIGHNYVLAPLFSLPYVAMPPPLWELLKIGIGGYVISRGAEKSLRVWRDGSHKE